MIRYYDMKIKLHFCDENNNPCTYIFPMLFFDTKPRDI